MSIQKLGSLLFIALAASSVAAQTKAPEPDYTLAFNLGAVTDYRFRGISQSRLDPAIQGGVDYAHKSGFYLGFWASSIKWINDAGGNADAELDFYGGYKGNAGDLGYDLGVLRYQYPSHNLAVSPNTTELYGALAFGPVTAKYSHAVTNTFGFASSKNSGYLDLSALFDLGSSFSLAPHIGHQEIRGSVGYSYTDYSLTLGKDMGGGISLSAALVGTDADKTLYVTPAANGSKFTGKNALVLGAKFSF